MTLEDADNSVRERAEAHSQGCESTDSFRNRKRASGPRSQEHSPGGEEGGAEPGAQSRG